MNWNDLYRILHEYYGDIQWWSPEDKLEVVVGSILGQNTTWSSAEKAIDNLKQAKLFTIKKLATADPEVVEQLVRPSGYYHLKTIRLQNLMQFILKKYKTLDNMFKAPLEQLREELLAINGIGPESADSILLYAGALPSFVVDAYTKRIVLRHGRDADIKPKNKSSRAQYDALWNSFMEQLEPHAPTMAMLHAYIIETAKQFCHKSKPQCEGCPLYRFERVNK
ncbi:MAG: endonuclease III domain-containing protein [Thermoguttaceae bacterium]|nr:endonuclease III domain-containing protein [Thermoguttaceae bacterium]